MTDMAIAPEGGTNYVTANPNYPEHLLGKRWDGTWRGETYAEMLNRKWAESGGTGPRDYFDQGTKSYTNPDGEPKKS